MSSDTIKVSICCFTYNHEEYIRDALDGFVMQKTDFDYEVIVHDDASTDATAAIIREYEQKYPNIIKPIYQTENQHSKNVNKMKEFVLPIIHGKYVAFCEGDDYWIDENKLQMQYDYMEEHGECSLVAHMALTYHMDGRYFAPYTKRRFSTEEQCLISAEEIINEHTVFPTASMFFRTDYYVRNAGFLSKLTAFDYLTKATLATEGSVYVIPRVMSVYRLGSNGSWTNRVYKNANLLEKHLLNAIYVLEKLDEYRDFKYHDAIRRNIDQRRFEIQTQLMNIKALKNEPFKGKYDTLSFKKKMLLYFRKYTPFLYRFYSEVSIVIKKIIYRKYKRI